MRARARLVITSLSAAVLYLAWIIHATLLGGKNGACEREREKRKGGSSGVSKPLSRLAEAGFSDRRTGVVGGREEASACRRMRGIRGGRRGGGFSDFARRL